MLMISTGSLATVLTVIVVATLHAMGAQAEEQLASSSPLLWVTPGGGVRASVSIMGFIRLFFHAGLISIQSSAFHSITSNSGAALLLAQFSFSQPFFESLLVDDQSLFLENAVAWLVASASGYIPEPTRDPVECESLKQLIPLGLSRVFPSVETYYNQCALYSLFDHDWGLYIEKLLNSSSSTIFNDPTLVGREMSPENRVSGLQETECLFQIGLSPCYKLDNEIVALGPRNSSNPDAIFSHPVGLQYVVQEDQTFFRYSEETDSVPFVAKTYVAPTNFTLDDWTDYFLPYPPPANASLLTTMTKMEAASSETFEFREPFGGKTPTVTQIAAASTAQYPFLSPTIPLLLAQWQSLLEYGLTRKPEFDEEEKTLARRTLEDTIRSLSMSGAMEGMALCTQWPEPCDQRDGMFIDGGYTDISGLPLALSNYQNNPSADLSKTLKVILTQHNWANETDGPLLIYFSSPYNKETAPGEYYWPPNSLPYEPKRQINPLPSNQAFKEYYDEHSWLEQMVPVMDGSFSTAIIKATTVDNPMFHVKGGQSVEILYMRINADFPREFFELESALPLLQDLAASLAGSEELEERVRSFVGTMTTNTSDTPSTSPTTTMGSQAPTTSSTMTTSLASAFPRYSSKLAGVSIVAVLFLIRV